MQAYLKIKIVSLSAEATLIRHEERRYNVGARGRTRARRLLAQKSNSMTNTQRHNLQRALIKPDETAMATFWGLRHHRIYDVREEARAANIAYGYLRGLSYKQIENKAKTEPNWTRVAALIIKYGPKGVTGVKDNLDAWKDAA